VRNAGTNPAACPATAFRVFRALPASVIQSHPRPQGRGAVADRDDAAADPHRADREHAAATSAGSTTAASRPGPRISLMNRHRRTEGRTWRAVTHSPDWKSGASLACRHVVARSPDRWRSRTGSSVLSDPPLPKATTDRSRRVRAIRPQSEARATTPATAVAPSATMRPQSQAVASRCFHPSPACPYGAPTPMKEPPLLPAPHAPAHENPATAVAVRCHDTAVSGRERSVYASQPEAWAGPVVPKDRRWDRGAPVIRPLVAGGPR
jgi:hypothetical protein